MEAPVDQTITADQAQHAVKYSGVFGKLSREDWNTLEKFFETHPEYIPLLDMMKKAGTQINKSDAFLKSLEDPLTCLGDNVFSMVLNSVLPNGLNVYQLIEGIKPSKKKGTKSKSNSKTQSEAKNDSPKKKKSAKPGAKKGQGKTRADEIRENNVAKNIIPGIVAEIVAVCGNEKQNQRKFPRQLLISRYVEVRMIGFYIMGLYYANALANVLTGSEMMSSKKSSVNSNSINSKEEVNMFIDAWAVMISIKRFRNVMVKERKEITKDGKEIRNQYQGPSVTDQTKPGPYSSRALEYMEEMYDRLDQVKRFDGKEVLRIARKLIEYSPYDEFVPRSSIRPEDHQIEITRTAASLIEFFCLYNAAIGSGKTTSVISIAQACAGNGRLLLCVCLVPSVLLQMLSLFYGAKMNFAYAYIKAKKDPRTNEVEYIPTIIKTNAMNKNNEADVIMCDPMTALSLIKAGEINLSKTILFFDEPTIGAEHCGSRPLKVSTKLLLQPFFGKIYCSATAPRIEDLRKFYNSNLERNPDFIVRTIYSGKIKSACDVFDSVSGKSVVPFIGCKTREELQHIINETRETSFIGRMFTADLVLKMGDLMKTNGLPIPDIADLFRNVVNLDPNVLRDFMTNMLETLSNAPNHLIAQICSSDIFASVAQNTDSKSDNSSDESDDNTFRWDDEPKTKTEPIKNPNQGRWCDYQNLPVTFDWKGQTLVATNDPLSFMRTNFGAWLASLNIKGSDVCTKYFNDLEKFKEEKNKLKAKLKIKENSDGAATDAKLRQIEMTMEGKTPRFPFPLFAQIGTKPHFEKYRKNSEQLTLRSEMDLLGIFSNEVNLASKKAKTPQYVEVGKLLMKGVPDDVLLALMCGIGILSSSIKDLQDPHYKSLVISLASKGHLAFVISDNSIVFGTNYPFSCVIVTEEFFEVHKSPRTIIQLIGRAGRFGFGAGAEAIVDPSIAEVLVDFAKNPDKYDTEVRNIKTTIDSVIQHKIQKEMDALHSIEEKNAPSRKITVNDLQFRIYSKTSSDTQADEINRLRKIVKSNPVNGWGDDLNNVP